jgi:HEAT repeat protein
MIPRRRKVVWIAGLVLSALGILALLICLGREPSEQGRSLSQWLEDLDNPSAATNVQTITAFRRMGAKAATRLVPMLEASDSTFRLRAVALARKQSFIEVRFTPAAERRARAEKAFEMMGEHAVAAAPRLVSLLVRRGTRPPEYLAERPGWDSADAAARALSHLGYGAIPYLRPALYNENPRVGQTASDVLVLLASYWTRETVAELLKLLEDSNPKVRKAGVYALGKFQRDPNLLIPRLERMLGDASSSVRRQTAFSLGRFGGLASNSVAALRRASSDSSPEVRYAAERALAEITGEAAASKEAGASHPNGQK